MVENGHFGHFWVQPGHFVGPTGPKWSKNRFFHKSKKCRENTLKQSPTDLDRFRMLLGVKKSIDPPDVHNWPPRSLAAFCARLERREGLAVTPGAARAS